MHTHANETINSKKESTKDENGIMEINENPYKKVYNNLKVSKSLTYETLEEQDYSTLSRELKKSEQDLKQFGGKCLKQSDQDIKLLREEIFSKDMKIEALDDELKKSEHDLKHLKEEINSKNMTIKALEVKQNEIVRFADNCLKKPNQEIKLLKEEIISKNMIIETLEKKSIRYIIDFQVGYATE